MRIRHKVPAIFSLSMVDMLCCALGCVILIWLLNAKQSEDEAEERRLETASILAQAQTDREESGRLLAAARGEHDRATAQVRTLLADREKAAALAAQLGERIRLLEQSERDLNKQLTDERSEAARLAAGLKETRGRVVALEGDVRTAATRLDEERGKAVGLDRQLADREAALRKLKADLGAAQASYATEKGRAESLDASVASKQQALATLGNQLVEARLARTQLEKTLADRDRELDAAATRAKALEKTLAERRLAMDDASRALARLEKLLKDREVALAEGDRKLTEMAKVNRAALEEALQKVLRLTKEKQDAQAEALRLEGERQAALLQAKTQVATLEKEKLQLRQASENRFAGITLTGKRVIFLVDASGSMIWVDETTKAPEKWTEVAQTVAKLMRSLPDLQQFQVLTFNARVEFPLGKPGGWIDYNPRTSADEVLRILARIEPSGGTDMHAAVQAAFTYRGNGLDTVYLLSDGLPNLGDGADEATARGLKGVDRSTYLSKKVRTRLLSEWNRPLPRLPQVKVNTVGFFYESPDLGAFLWALARENQGNFVGMSRP